MYEESDVSNKHMTCGKMHGGSVWTADHTCRWREAVDDSGEQPVAEEAEGETRGERDGQGNAMEILCTS